MNTELDASIPVLTEVISADALISEADSVALDLSEKLPEMATRERGTINDEEWQLMEQTLRENVLKQVLARVDFVLEHRVRDNLADVLQTAVEKLADEIRAGLKNSLEEVVTRAVTQEIAKAKTPK